MIKQLLKNNRAAQRIKALKDLFLEKLDYLQQTLNSLQNAVNHVENATHQNREELRLGLEQNSYHTNQILENQVFLIKSALDTARSIQYLLETGQQRQIAVEQMINDIRKEFQNIREESQRSNGFVHQEFQNIREESQRSYQFLHQEFQTILDNLRRQDTFLQEKLTQIAADVHDQKFKVVTDPSYFQAIDIELMIYLYSFLPHRRAIDVGANRGDVSVRLLGTGYEVYALEPFPPVLEKLKERLGNNPNFHALPYALGAVSETRELHVAADQTEDNTYDDATFYNSLTPHSLSEGLVFTETIPVTVKTLASLHEAGTIPTEIGLVKIDTEGFDLEVIKGMGDFRYPVVLAEFWDPSFPFGQVGAMNHLKDMVPAMQERGYSWHIIIYRIWGNHDISYYCNSDYSLENSWGNVFFFQDYKIFSEALKWCNATMPATYFSV